MTDDEETDPTPDELRDQFRADFEASTRPVTAAEMASVLAMLLRYQDLIIDVYTTSVELASGRRNMTRQAAIIDNLAALNDELKQAVISLYRNEESS